MGPAPSHRRPQECSAPLLGPLQTRPGTVPGSLQGMLGGTEAPAPREGPVWLLLAPGLLATRKGVQVEGQRGPMQGTLRGVPAGPRTGEWRRAEFRGNQHQAPRSAGGVTLRPPPQATGEQQAGCQPTGRTGLRPQRPQTPPRVKRKALAQPTSILALPVRPFLRSAHWAVRAGESRGAVCGVVLLLR